MLNKDIVYGIGLMSGTSLDGVDVSLVRISKNGNDYDYKLIFFASYPYTESLKKLILKNSNVHTSNIQEICSLNCEIGQTYVESVEKFLKSNHIDLNLIDYIASHGQTIWHNPHQMDGYYSSTLQIGDASQLAYHFNKTVVYDFRSLDMASGGVGAPLIPITEFLLYTKKDRSRILLNIGGISNITYLKKCAKRDEIIAFDTGCGNMLIDGAMKKIYNRDYDLDGIIASSGTISNILLDFLLEDKYYQERYPKATGREKYNDEYLNKIINYAKVNNINDQDIITTLSYFTAFIISYQINKFFPNFTGCDELIVSGGGSHNKYIINELKKKATYKVYVADDLGINADGKEAMGFAILGFLRLINKTSNVKQVTGAKDNVSLGSIIFPPKISEE